MKDKKLDSVKKTPRRNGSDGEDKGNLSVVRAFRLHPDDADKWDSKVARSGRTASEFFREAVIRNKTEVVAVRPLNPSQNEILRLLAKQGNNVNQIAKSLNTARKEGDISESDYLAALRELQEINDHSTFILNELF